MDGLPCVLCLLSFSCLMTLECLFAGGAPFPARAQLHGEERERGLLHQGHFVYKNFVFKNCKNVRTLIIPNAQTTW